MSTCISKSSNLNPLADSFIPSSAAILSKLNLEDKNVTKSFSKYVANRSKTEKNLKVLSNLDLIEILRVLKKKSLNKTSTLDKECEDLKSTANCEYFRKLSDFPDKIPSLSKIALGALPKSPQLLIAFAGLHQNEQATRPTAIFNPRPEKLKDSRWSISSQDKKMWNSCCTLSRCNCPPMFGYCVPPDFFGNPFNLPNPCKESRIHLNHYAETEKIIETNIVDNPSPNRDCNEFEDVVFYDDMNLKNDEKLESKQHVLLSLEAIEVKVSNEMKEDSNKETSKEAKILPSPLDGDKILSDPVPVSNTKLWTFGEPDKNTYWLENNLDVWNQETPYSVWNSEWIDAKAKTSIPYTYSWLPKSENSTHELEQSKSFDPTRLQNEVFDTMMPQVSKTMAPLDLIRLKRKRDILKSRSYSSWSDSSDADSGFASSASQSEEHAQNLTYDRPYSKNLSCGPYSQNVKLSWGKFGGPDSLWKHLPQCTSENDQEVKDFQLKRYNYNLKKTRRIKV